MLITNAQFNASHKHWVEHKHGTSMAVSGMAVIFINSRFVVIHTTHYRIVISRGGNACNVCVKPIIGGGNGQCVYTSMFTDKLLPSIDHNNRLSAPFSLQLNKNYRVNMMICKILLTNVTVNVGTEL